MSDSQDAADTQPKGSTPRRQSPVDYFEELRADILFVEVWETVCAHNYPGRPPPEPEWPMIGHFEAREWVGHGGYGAVVIGRDTRLDRLVALKLCPATLDPKAERKFRREVQLLAACTHSNIVTVYEIGSHGGDLFCAMEYIDGVDGASYLNTDPSHVEIVETYCRAGEGLAVAHDKGIAHGDFKPPNVLIGKDGRVCVADFGLARRIDESDEASEPGSSSYREGTLHYVAPELLGGARPSAASDQWAFCVSLWLSLFLRYPFEAEDETSLLVSISLGPKPARTPPGLRADVREVLCRGLSIEPAARYPSMSALVGELRRLLTDAASVSGAGLEVETDPGAESAPESELVPEPSGAGPIVADDSEIVDVVSADVVAPEVGRARALARKLSRYPFALAAVAALSGLGLGARMKLRQSVPPASGFRLGSTEVVQVISAEHRQWRLSVRRFNQAKDELQREDLEACYEIWDEGSERVRAQKLAFVYAAASLGLARQVADAEHGDLNVKTAGMVAQGAAKLFQEGEYWWFAKHARIMAVEFFGEAGLEWAAAEENRCAAAHDIKQVCD